MEKLRIHLTKYRNRGMANKKLKGQQEHHVIFKFDTEPEAKDFTAKVKDWYYSLESVKDKVIDVLNEEARKKALNKFNKLDLHSEETKKKITDELVKAAGQRPGPAKRNIKKDEKTKVVKTTRKKPGPAKGTGGRPKANIQR